MKKIFLIIIFFNFSCSLMDVPKDQLNLAVVNSYTEVNVVALPIGNVPYLTNYNSRHIEKCEPNYVKDIKIQESNFFDGPILSSRGVLGVDEKEFFIVDAAGYISKEKLVAKKVYDSLNCIIYVEKTALANYNPNVWPECGQEFNLKIYDKLISVFGQPSDIDNNGKIIILYYNIPPNGTIVSDYIAGFFYKDDLKKNNFAEIMYLNLQLKYKDAPNSSIMYRTLAHEFQHMISEGNRVIKKGLPDFELWLNEAMSMVSEEIYLNGKVLPDCMQYLKEDTKGLIRNGISFMPFTNQFDQYCLTYIFLRYVQIQSGLNNIAFFDAIMNSPDKNYKVLEKILIENNSNFRDWADILNSFHLANLKFDDIGKYGYLTENKKYFWDVKYPSQMVKYLKTGGAIYLKVDSKFKPSFNSPYINFIRKDGTLIN